LILGRGNVMHNLRRVDWSQPDGSYDWAKRFDEKVTEVMTSSPVTSCRLSTTMTTRWSFPHRIISSPWSMSPAWLTPLNSARVLVDGYAMGSLSMTCFALGCNELAAIGTGEAPPPLPHVPADESNL
jgi:4,5-DOPA dioxygenase extradiol